MQTSIAIRHRVRCIAVAVLSALVLASITLPAQAVASPAESIEMSSYSFEGPSKFNIGLAHAGKSLPHLIVVRKVDALSGKLYKACTNGTHFSSLRLTNAATTIVAYDAVIGRISTTKTGTPTETLTVRYGKIEIPK